MVAAGQLQLVVSVGICGRAEFITIENTVSVHITKHDNTCKPRLIVVMSIVFVGIVIYLAKHATLSKHILNNY